MGGALRVQPKRLRRSCRRADRDVQRVVNEFRRGLLHLAQPAEHFVSRHHCNERVAPAQSECIRQRQRCCDRVARVPPVHREVRVVEVEVAHHQFVGKGGEFRCGALAGEPHAAQEFAAPAFLRQCPRNRRRLPVLPPDGAPDGVHEAHLHPVHGVRRDVVVGQPRNVGAEMLGQRVHDAGLSRAPR